MAASGLTAAREEEGLGLERGWGEGAFSTVWLPSITPPSWPVGVAVFNMQTNGQKNVYPHAHTHHRTWHTHTHMAHTGLAVLHSKRKYIGAFKYAKEVCT